MTRLALLLCVLLSACGFPGISTYDIHPYYEQATGQEVCCAVKVTSGRDVQSATIDVTKSPDGSITAHYTETGANASAPIAANGVTASAVSGAVTTAIDAGLKFSLKP
jgi:hypothetical protein